MARFFTYSFEDTTVTISHPNVGVYTAYGTGLGSVTVEYADNIAEHTVATDLSVVISKHAYRNGQVTISLLQSSDFSKWMNKFTKYLENSGASEFALATLTIANKSTGDSYVCSGVCPQKRPNDSFQAAAQSVDWVLLAADIATN